MNQRANSIESITSRDQMDGIRYTQQISEPRPPTPPLSAYTHYPLSSIFPIYSTRCPTARSAPLSCGQQMQAFVSRLVSEMPNSSTQVLHKADTYQGQGLFTASTSAKALLSSKYPAPAWNLGRLGCLRSHSCPGFFHAQPFDFVRKLLDDGGHNPCVVWSLVMCWFGCGTSSYISLPSPLIRGVRKFFDGDTVEDCVD